MFSDTAQGFPSGLSGFCQFCVFSCACDCGG